MNTITPINDHISSTSHHTKEHLLELTKNTLEDINLEILNKEEQVEILIACLLSEGHVLLEDIPGTGKTTLAKTLSTVMSLMGNRIQMTSETLPSDILGQESFNQETRITFFDSGPIQCNIFLCDELNRAPTKTQSALLTPMEEFAIPRGKNCTELTPLPFFLIATQNPFGSIGTNPISDAILDRFSVSLSLGYPDKSSEIELYKRKKKNHNLNKKLRKNCLTKESIIQCQELVSQFHISDAVYDYIYRLVNATRNNEKIKQGLSTRAALSFVAFSKALAFIRGKDFVTFEEVSYAFPYVASHRINNKNAIKEILNEVAAIV